MRAQLTSLGLLCSKRVFQYADIIHHNIYIAERYQISAKIQSMALW